MFTIHRSGPERVSLTLTGRIDKQMMSDGLDLLLRESSGFTQGKMLYRIHELHWPTFEAIVVELKRIPALFSLVRRFDRVAIVADAAWIRRVGTVEGRLIPGIEIESFEDEEQAIHWLDHASPHPH